MKSPWILLPMAALVMVASTRNNPVSSQQNGTAAPNPQSSLDLGAPFDKSAKRAFELQLDDGQAARLIMFKSRYALADTSCPVPTQDPAAPFYVKFKGPLSQAAAARLEEAGLKFIGYVWPHAHIVRAGDPQLLPFIAQMLRNEPEVVGTLAQRREDKLSRGAYEQGPVGDLFVLFWRDAAPQAARNLLDLARATVVEATRDADGLVDLNTPRVIVRVDAQGFETLLQSHLVEQISLAPFKTVENQTSAAISSATPAILGGAPYNLDGTGQIVGVWDNGHARDTHQQFQNAPSPSLINNGTRRVLRVGTSSTQDHATHVTCTIMGDGTGNATARGFAYRGYALSHLWNNVDQGRRDAKHTWNHVADNHSYSSFGGGNDDWGEYTAECQINDFTNRDYLLPMVQSAGNYAASQPGGSGPKPYTGGTQTVPSFNAHRNGFIIAAVQDNLDITSFSSRGPCDDGRLVPQFSANGEGLTSAVRSSDTAYASFSGTSMSGPSVCGGITLLSQLWRRDHSNRIFEPDTARAVLALTCQDRGNTGPDYIYGFGIMNVQAAADLIMADTASNGARIVRGAVHQSEVVEYPIVVPAATPSLRVACSWLDIYANAAAQVAVVNDLDVELVEPNGSTIRYPYSGLLAGQANGMNHVFTTAGPNRRDNLELCHVANPVAGTWRVRVRGFSVPASPQTATPNNVVGFVLASNLNITRQHLNFEDTLNTGTAVAIPDNNATGITRTFNVSDTRPMHHVRVTTRIVHDRRGDIEIILRAPNATQVNLKTVNTGDNDTYDDVIGVFPDTRQYDDDITALKGLPVNGAWQVIVRDRASGNTGTLNYLALQFDVHSNTAPIADAGTNQNVREGANGQLNATASSDPDGDNLTYAWTQIAGAVSVTLSGANTATPTFVGPAVSQNEVVTFRVTVTDPSMASSQDTVQVTITNNQPPVADAGQNQNVREVSPVNLTAAGSTDPESDPLTYAWTQVSGTAATLTGASTMTPSFTAPAVSMNEALVFEVTVTDNRGDFDTDQVTINVLNNAAPVADAGPNQSVREVSPVNLTAAGSTDPESDPMTFAWTQLSGTAATLTGANTMTPSFTAPAVAATEVLVFEVTVTDNRGDFGTDQVSITVQNNTAPLANAGMDQSVREGLAVNLDASTSSNAESDPMTFSWTQTSGLAVTLSGATTATPSFTAPSVSQNEILEFEVTVTDDRGDFGTDTVQITVLNNAAPVAAAGLDFAVIDSDPVQLNGTASSDSESDPMAFSWTQLSGISVTLTAAASATPSFIAPVVTQNEVLIFELTVTDDRGDFSTDTVAVTVELNLPPVANAGPDLAVMKLGTGQLNAGASTDPNTGDTLSYLWTQVSGPTVTLSSATSVNPTFTAGNADAELEFDLTVFDLRGLSDTDRVKIYVNSSGTIPGGGGGKDKDSGGGCDTGEGFDFRLAIAWACIALTVMLRTRRQRARAKC